MMLMLNRVTRLTMLFVAAATIFTISAGDVFADHHEKDGKKGGRDWNPDAMFDRADADGDGNVSREEFHAALKKRMEHAKEWRGKMAERHKARKKMAEKLEAAKSTPALKLQPAKKKCDGKKCDLASSCKGKGCKGCKAKGCKGKKRHHHAHRGHHGHRSGHHAQRGHHGRRPASIALRAHGMSPRGAAVAPGQIGVINAKVVNINYHFHGGPKAGARHGFHKSKWSKAKKCGKAKCGKSKCSKSKCGKSKCSKSKKCCGKCGKGKKCPLCERGKRASLDSDAAAGLAEANTEAADDFEVVSREEAAAVQPTSALEPAVIEATPLQPASLEVETEAVELESIESESDETA